VEEAKKKKINLTVAVGAMFQQKAEVKECWENV
jgi:hypothetical protein